MTSWLAARYGLRWGMGRELVRVARALEALPAISEAHARGRLSFDQLRPLTRFATAETDERWARRAPELSAGALYREAERHQQVRSKDALELHRARSLRMWWDDERPLLYLDGILPSEQGAAFEKALSERFERLPAKIAGGEAVPPDARMADALVELVAGDSAPTNLVVHASAEVLTREAPRRGPWLAETESGTRLCTESVRRLACEARIDWVLESAHGPVGIGRRGRAVPARILRLLRHRDHGRCRFPGCGRRSWLNAHHLVHWADGGGTNLHNLVLLCGGHHRLIHEGGWRTSGHPAQDLRFHDPTGRPIGTCPPELRPEVKARYFP